MDDRAEPEIRLLGLTTIGQAVVFLAIGLVLTLVLSAIFYEPPKFVDVGFDEPNSIQGIEVTAKQPRMVGDHIMAGDTTHDAYGTWVAVDVVLRNTTEAKQVWLREFILRPAAQPTPYIYAVANTPLSAELSGVDDVSDITLQPGERIELVLVFDWQSWRSPEWLQATDPPT